jgi:DNA repair protein RAD50
VHSYVRNKSAKALKECSENIEQFEKEIHDLAIAIEGARVVVANIDKEINESGASVANLRDNMRLRKLIRDIAATQDEIDSLDMEEAAKAKRTFEDQYKVKKAQESELQSKVFIIESRVYVRNIIFFSLVCSYCR